MATWDFNINISVYGESQSVDIQNFGRAVWATEDVDTGFTEAYRLYTSNNAVQQDADLLAAAKLAGAAFFSQELRPRDLMIASVTYLTLGVDLDALLVETQDFYGLACSDRTDVTQEALADWVVANQRIGSIQSSTAAITAGTGGNLFETLNADNNNRAFGTWHPDDAQYPDLDWLATILSADMDSQASVAHDKELVGVTAPDSTEIDDTKRATVEGYNGNLYLPFKGGPVMRPGLMFGGDWIEDKILEDWLEARLGEAFARLAKRKSNANSKIEYTDDGIADVEAEVRAVIEKGEAIGHFEEDTLVLDVPKLADISAAVRATKKLTMEGTVQKTGGIKDFDFSIGVIF